jgi:hypothetical protein
LHRTQYVQVEAKLSDPKPTGDQGVPQGSILGPILFLAFYIDFPESKYPPNDNPPTPEPTLTLTPTSTNLPCSSQSVLYADDDTDHAQDRDPNVLISKIQHEDNHSSSWVSDNGLVCSGGKTKLLIIGTNAMRRIRLAGKQIQIQVCGKVVKESNCEKILGILVNNKLTWSNYLSGDYSDPEKPISGLIQQLSKRVGMLARLSKVMPTNKFKCLINGLFYSKLLYCLPLYANVIGVGDISHHNSFTKANLKSLQILQNELMCLYTGHGYDTPVRTLLEDSDMLSVNQLVAYSTISTVFKIKTSSHPSYLAERLGFSGNRNNHRSHCNKHVINIRFNLSTAQEGFIYKAAKLWSSLPLTLIQETSAKKFKKCLKAWVKLNIPDIPK